MIPLRFWELTGLQDRLLFTTDTGNSFLSSRSFLERYISDELRRPESTFFHSFGAGQGDFSDLQGINYIYELAQRHAFRHEPDYFILVPTLRCNLSCSYCQVSRANVNSAGFDWTDEVTEATINYIIQNSAADIKLEFQGGEPTLRLDLVAHVLDELESTKNSVEAVICTNLSEISTDLLTLLDRGNVFISTSIDGSLTRQARQRTGSESEAQSFFDNVDMLIERYGVEKVSALPTIDPDSPPPYEELYENFVGRGLNSIFLRPINFQGFARRRHAASRSRKEEWATYYRGFVHYLIERGAETNYAPHEFYFTQVLRRIFRGGENGHVDLRNPSIMGIDYLLIDYDGRFFPSDEARMLDRIGEIDLSFGDVITGIDHEKRITLNETAFNDEDPDCIHCAFQPYCGSDMVDTVSRYGRVDIPRGETSFCQDQLQIFDFVFSMLANPTDKQRVALARWLELPEVPRNFLEVLS